MKSIKKENDKGSFSYPILMINDYEEDNYCIIVLFQNPNRGVIVNSDSDKQLLQVGENICPENINSFEVYYGQVILSN